ncbi:MAG: membrane dipeptidase [Vicinamibacteria bacterium]|nr:membrane dipeptidase [Vicinamibacteria bacterium]
MKRGVKVVLLLVLGGGALLGLAPGLAERRMNRVTDRSIEVSDRARKIHASLFVADLHADTTLWNRNLLARGSRGHVDVPRLIEGGLALQAFTIVTKTPRNMNIERNTAKSDNITLLAVAQLWPPRTWNNLTERALYQASRITDAAARSEGRLSVIRTAADLDAFVTRRSQDRKVVAAFIGVEGAHALSGSLANLDRLFDAGVRMMAPTHFFDTEIGGSAHGESGGGLTPLGRQWVERMEAKKMLIDLAHASSKTIDDVLGMATRPMVVSHTGVRGTCDNRRNLSDAQLAAISAKGGVIGIGVWETAVCGKDAHAIARAIAHAVNVAGFEHVALGSDFDGAVEAPFDATGLPQITQAMLDLGLDRTVIEGVMGGNIRRLLQASLP